MGLTSRIARKKVHETLAALSAEHMDLDLLAKDWAEDIVCDVPSGLGPGERIKGKEALAGFHKRWEEEFPQRKLVLKDVL